MENKEPLSPHIQIYRWHISSLVSISHRITGIINIVAITLICLWASLLLLGESKYETIEFFLNSFVGKFIILSLTWSFLFQILSGIRHLIMDFGYWSTLRSGKYSAIGTIFLSILFSLILIIQIW